MAVTALQIEGPLSVVPNANVWPLAADVFYVATAAQRAAFGKASKGFRDRLYPTTADALTACTSARGDKIQILEGYTETVSAADAWSNLGSKTNVEIVGCGTGYSRPTFTYSAATATILMDQAGFKIRGCNFYMAGDPAASAALTVAAPITASAAGCEFTDNFCHFGVDADQLVTIGFTTTAAADFLTFSRNNCWGATAAECTSFFYAVGADHLVMHDNRIQGGTSSTTVGVLRFITTLSLDIDIRNCSFQNMKAASIHAVTQMAGVLGTVQDCSFGILDNATLAGWVPAGAGDGPQLFRCKTANLAMESGADTTPVSA